MDLRKRQVEARLGHVSGTIEFSERLCACLRSADCSRAARSTATTARSGGPAAGRRLTAGGQYGWRRGGWYCSSSHPRCPDLSPCDAGPLILSVPRTRRHADAMAVRGWGRLGWALSPIATIALAAYLVSVGWSRANLTAGVGAFFVAVAGLAVALAARHPRTSRKRAHIVQKTCDATAESTDQEAHVSPWMKVTQRMNRITVRRISQCVRQAAQLRALKLRHEGNRDGP